MEEHALIDKLVLIGALAIAAQWLAWRLHLPAIVLLAAGGILAGPAFGWLEPEADFGPLLQPMISLAVAVILFEGGLHLRLKDLQEVGGAVGRLVLIGAPLAWLLTAAAGSVLAGLSWQVALLFGGILVVTGPIVIIPLLRQAKLRHEPAAILKWEGIVNDPIGALLAVLVYELVTLSPQGHIAVEIGRSLLGIALAALLGFAVGRGFTHLIHRGQIAEFLKGPAVLGILLVCFLVGNLLQDEAGLVTVTVLGITLANTGLAEIDQVRRLKEYITVILVSGLFIILSASLDAATLAALGWPAIGFLAALLFVARPASILLATLSSEIAWNTRLLLARIAPRGIVAVAVSGLFGGLLVEAGFADGAKLVPLAFAVVLATVLAHGFTLRPLATGSTSRAGPSTAC